MKDLISNIKNTQNTLKELEELKLIIPKNNYKLKLINTLEIHKITKELITLKEEAKTRILCLESDIQKRTLEVLNYDDNSVYNYHTKTYLEDSIEEYKQQLKKIKNIVEELDFEENKKAFRNIIETEKQKENEKNLKKEQEKLEATFREFRETIIKEKK